MSNQSRKMSAQNIDKGRALSKTTVGLSAEKTNFLSAYLNTFSISNLLVMEKGIVIKPYVAANFGIYYDEIVSIKVEWDKSSYNSMMKIIITTSDENRPSAIFTMNEDIIFIDVLEKAWGKLIERAYEREYN
jgi:hypothetical protein